MSDQSGQAGASAAAAGTATGVLRIHLGHVAENLTLSFLLGGAAAALTQGLTSISEAVLVQRRS